MVSSQSRRDHSYRRIGREMGAKENSDRYRAYEAECIRHAKLAIDDATRRRLEGLAHQWHEFAERSTVPMAVIATTADTSRSRGSK
jgi:hypothetical protein